MKENSNNCDCGVLSQITFCDDETYTKSADVEVVTQADTIQPTDQLLIIRQDCQETKVYKAAFKDISSEVALIILEKAIQSMPHADPADGRSLWIDDGFIRIASDDLTQLGRVSADALQRSLTEIFKTLPTYDPCDGGPWLNGDVLMRGSNSNINE